MWEPNNHASCHDTHEEIAIMGSCLTSYSTMLLVTQLRLPVLGAYGMLPQLKTVISCRVHDAGVHDELGTRISCRVLTVSGAHGSAPMKGSCVLQRLGTGYMFS